MSLPPRGFPSPLLALLDELGLVYYEQTGKACPGAIKVERAEEQVTAITFVKKKISHFQPSGDPYTLVELVYLPPSRRCLTRVFGRTVDTVKAEEDAQIEQAFRKAFQTTAPCRGFIKGPATRGSGSLLQTSVQLDLPFPRTVSKACPGFVASPLEESQCPSCLEEESRAEQECSPCDAAFMALVDNLEVLKKHIGKEHGEARGGEVLPKLIRLKGEERFREQQGGQEEQEEEKEEEEEEPWGGETFEMDVYEEDEVFSDAVEEVRQDDLPDFEDEDDDDDRRDDNNDDDDDDEDYEMEIPVAPSRATRSVRASVSSLKVKKEPRQSSEEGDEGDEDYQPEDNEEERALKARKQKMRAKRLQRTRDAKFDSLSPEITASGEPLCLFCEGRPFFNLDKWRDHIFTVHHKAKYYCLHCQEVANFPQEMEQHVNEEHPGQEKNVCPICEEEVDIKNESGGSYELYVQHCRDCKRARRNRSNIKCTVCLKQVPKYTLKTHMGKHAKEEERKKRPASARRYQKSDPDSLKDIGEPKPKRKRIRKPTRPSKGIIGRYTPARNAEDQPLCAMCDDRPFETLRKWKDHQFAFHYRSRYPCESCEIYIGYPAEIEEHVLNTHPEKPHVRCPFCRELCPVGPPHDPFLDHARACKKALRSGIKVPCPQCGKFLDRHSLEKHIEYVHEKSDCQKVSCEQCGKMFSNEACLYQHKIKAHGSGHDCPQCDRSFGVPSMLNVHIRTAHDPPAFACSFCGKSFRRKNKLLEHERLAHTGEAKLMCELCQLPFDSTDLLQKHHLLRHRDIRCAAEEKRKQLAGKNNGEEVKEQQIPEQEEEESE